MVPAYPGCSFPFLGLFFNWLFIFPSNYIIWMEARKKGWKKEMINTYENQDIEFKQEYVSDINILISSKHYTQIDREL